MTKAGVRAMDTITDFLAKPESGSVTIDKFVVAGASSAAGPLGAWRRWTRWPSCRS